MAEPAFTEAVVLLRRLRADAVKGHLPPALVGLATTTEDGCYLARSALRSAGYYDVPDETTDPAVWLAAIDRAIKSLEASDA